MSKFDPAKHTRRLPGRGGASDYLDVKWRLVWLRSEHPDARIDTEHVTLGDEIAVFKATIAIPGGGSATGYGSETPRDFGDYIEKAETKAIGRALIALGYGTQAALLGDDEKPNAQGGLNRDDWDALVAEFDALIDRRAPLADIKAYLTKRRPEMDRQQVLTMAARYKALEESDYGAVAAPPDDDPAVDPDAPNMEEPADD